MAITKLMHMKSSKSGSQSSHLKNAINYILKKEKVAVSDGIRLSGTNGCILGNAYQDMMRTKQHYGKTDGRQGYHFVIAFRPGQATSEEVYKITEEFVREYLSEYECVYAVHNDTDHQHAHIVFNSVSYVTGYKYHYSNRDWERKIQPIVDRLCIENGLPPLEYHIDEYDNEMDTRLYTHYTRSFNWKEEIKSDIDECISQSADWNAFIIAIKKTGYTINFNKYMSVRKNGMGRARRLTEKQMGYAYTPEGIITRIKINQGEITLKNASPYIKGTDKLPESLRVNRRYKKYKDMSFEEKIKIRHILKIKDAIPELKVYPGAFYTDRKIKELHQAEQELMVMKKYGIHSESDMKHVIADLEQREKEVREGKSRQEYMKQRYRELTHCIEIIDAYEESSAGKNNLSDTTSKDIYIKSIENNVTDLERDSTYSAEKLQEYISAREKIETAGETEMSVRKFIDDCRQNDKKFKNELNNIRKQKLAVKRLQKRQEHHKDIVSGTEKREKIVKKEQIMTESEELADGRSTTYQRVTSRDGNVSEACRSRT